jgi:glyoxylase-like metal-dependent hydrolase (beta-lactamase superfamily II)/8-oxo-dGTP pyrophosphatase MutT (NUDIX family)
VTTIPPRPSATIVLLREGDDAQLEALLLQRADRGDQNSLRWVFPGGLVDETDRALRTRFYAWHDEGASASLGVTEGGLDYWTAALRETLEEAGLLFALDAAGRWVDAATHAAALTAWRDQVHALPRGQGGAAFAALCESRGWHLPGADHVLPIAHWITPRGMPKRFDTFFFVAAAAREHAVCIDGVEIVDHRWARLADLAAQRGDVTVQGPTLAVAKDLARATRLDDALAWARSLGPLPVVAPRLALDAQGRFVPVPPSHPAHAEIGRIDPDGRGLAHSVIRTRVAVDLAEGRLLRVTADNGSVMTGPGTNSYLLHAAGDDWVLIDPGPDEAAHVQALRAALSERGARLVAIVVTHTHIDHSPAAQAVREATGARLIGRLAEHRAGQDPRFVPDHAPADGERLDFGGGCVLRAIHTPGHASNHLCWLHEGLRVLFTGDHVMQGSTVVINPPDGDMGAYFDSLHKVAREAGVTYDAIAPGHGFLIEQPARALDALIAHRRAREDKVRRVLAESAGTTIDDLLVRVYDDVPAARHPIARRSLLAHLQHLHQQGFAEERHGGCWWERRTERLRGDGPP